jgi:hypothetical protein
MLKPSKLDYFVSLSEELGAQANRVRQLIGSAHWGHDGRHKELLLMELIRRHCPASILVSTGFLVSPHNLAVRSSEQDILVVDTSIEAPLFQQGGLVIAFAHTLVAAISVKTTMDAESLKDTIDGLQTVRKVIRDANLNAEKIWCGGFFYAVKPAWRNKPHRIYDHIKRYIVENPAPGPIVDDDRPRILGPNCIADSNELAFIFDYQRNGDEMIASVRGYSCVRIATAVFLACLLEHIAMNLDAAHSPFSDFVTDLAMAPINPPSFSLFREG